MASIYRAIARTTLAVCGGRRNCEARKNPNIARDELTGIEDRHILDVLDRQKRAGFKIFTDGELRRTGFNPTDPTKFHDIENRPGSGSQS